MSEGRGGPDFLFLLLKKEKRGLLQEGAFTFGSFSKRTFWVRKRVIDTFINI